MDLCTNTVRPMKLECEEPQLTDEEGQDEHLVEQTLPVTLPHASWLDIGGALLVHGTRETLGQPRIWNGILGILLRCCGLIQASLIHVSLEECSDDAGRQSAWDDCHGDHKLGVQVERSPALHIEVGDDVAL